MAFKYGCHGVMVALVTSQIKLGQQPASQPLSVFYTKALHNTKLVIMNAAKESAFIACYVYMSMMIQTSD